ncbi:MAG TPA: NADH-quinone oxidoreductase subunit C [Bdellovibrionota bacterium]|nr:NADH-quinone oxidoreductase subunit C [Bdellovibrionota bacterium]
MEITDIRNFVPTTFGDWVPKFGELWKTQISALRHRFGENIQETRMPPDYPTDVPIIYVKKESILNVLSFMKTDSTFEYNFLSDLTATDESIEPRFELVYNLFSTTKLVRIRLKVRLRDGEEAPTATAIWPGANWSEREVFDMFGIRFAGHPDLRRILMDIRYVGHPLRKDFPLKGYQIFTEPELADPALLEE